VDGGATLILTNSAGLNASSGANVTLTGDSGGQGIIVGPLSLGGSGQLTVNGATWRIAPNNTYSGLTTINSGVLQITGNGSLGSVPGSFNASQISLNGGALEVMTNFNLTDGNRGITVSSSSTITVDSNATFTVANDISGSGSATLTKSGPGTMVLSGANDYMGFLNIDTASASAADGRVVIANNGALAHLLPLQGTPSIFIRNNNAGTSTLALDGSSGSINVLQDISLAGRNNSVPAIDNLAGNNTISGYFELATGGNYLLQSDSGTLDIQQAWPYEPPSGVTTTRTLILSGSGTITMSGGVQDGSLLGTNVPTAIIEMGPGVANLPTANTYSGSTTISNGVLSLTGSISSTGGVFVAGGALAGTGTINDNVTVSSSSASGTIDALAVNGNFTISGPLAVDVNRSGLQSDKPTVSGGITNTGSGSIVVNNLGSALQVGDRFVLFNKAVANGASMAVSGGGVQWNNNLATDGSITVASTLAATPTNITFNVTGGNLSLSWPADYKGWILQAQTNSLSTGLSTNWHDVAGSGSVTNLTMTINPANGTAFYRLRLPQ
jgi:fibronectin-binding autotransporter adhesin